MGEHIPGARMVELPGDDHLPWEGDQESLLDEIERFLAGVRDEVEPDRVLATLLVHRYRRLDREGGRLGDRAWNDLLARHHRLVRAQLARFRGREVDTAGDGFFATFDGPARAVRCASAIVASRPRAGPRGPRRRPHRRGRADGRRASAESPSHIGARIAAAARPGEVLVSSTVKDIVAGSGIAFEERGEHELSVLGVHGTCSQPTAERSPVDSMPSAPIASMHGVGLDASTGKPPLRPPAATNEGSRPTAIRERGLVRL